MRSNQARHVRRLAALAAMLIAASAGYAQDQSSEEAEWFFTSQKWEQAAKAYERIVQRDVDNGLAWFRLGYARHMLKDYDRAIAAHRRAANFETGRASALYNLACAYAMKERTDEAFESLEKALDAGFNDKTLLREDSDLAGLRDDRRFARLMSRFDAPLPEEFHQFDFWLGDWESADPAAPGASEVEKVESGRLITERWAPASGASSRGMIFYDPALRKWRAFFISSAGEMLRGEGELRDGAMVFEGPRVADAAQSMFRLTYSHSNDEARRLLEVSEDGHAFKPLSDLKLKRRAADAPPIRPAPGATPPPPEYAELEFWIGDWQVRGEDGRLVGEERVGRRDAGRILMQTWKSALHQTGRAMIGYDAADKVWRYLWVDDSGLIQTLAGRVEQGALKLSGTCSLASGARHAVRSTLSQEKSGRLRHVSELSEDEGATWKPRFDLTYERAGRPKAAG